MSDKPRMRFALIFALLWRQTWSFSPLMLNKQDGASLLQRSTPFEAGYYDSSSDDDDDDNAFAENKSPLCIADKNTQLVVGFNKYSHDTSICAANAATGQVLFCTSLERLSRKKHDAGNVATLVEACCYDSLELSLDNIVKVIVNNHHYRVLPIETNNRAHMEWESGLHINGGAQDGYDEDENLLDHAEKLELSHHLAHAYSTATQAPFDSGMVVVMDGMGETYRTMARAEITKDESYISDLSFGLDSFECVPANLGEIAQTSVFDWREAESIYVFEKKEHTMDLVPIFKRFQQEKTPPTLYNHGFENMDSLGALYSRASMHIFGDWNACGKVMGLAPWKVHEWKTENDNGGATIAPEQARGKIMWGSLYANDSSSKAPTFQIDRTMMEGVPHIARNDADLFDEYTMVRRKRYDFDDDQGDDMPVNPDNNEEQPKKRRLPAKVALDAITLSSRIQDDLEKVVLDFVGHFKTRTGQTNLCLAGGVALNSVTNGRLARELGFEETYISPYPGDDGIAVGCCAFGLYGNERLAAKKTAAAKTATTSNPPPVWKQPLSPYLGPEPTEFDIKRAIEWAAPWLDVDTVRNENRRVELVAQEIESGGVVAWYNGRSEVGPRALGHRSILADPRKKGLVRFINEHVKKRESFRPFAPSVLAEEADKWFDLRSAAAAVENNVSPYMSMTAYVKESKRSLIPAVTHVDGSSRLQTVTKEAEPLYHKLITAFFERTKVPMVLNTSFNTLKSEPIVETPKNAVRSFLCSMGSIEMLVMGDYIIKRRPANLRTLLGEARKDDDTLLTSPTCPKRTGKVFFESSFQLQAGKSSEDDADTVTRVSMPDRPMHHETANNFVELTDELEGELLSICDGTHTVNDMVGFYTARSDEDEISDKDVEDSREIFEQIARRLIRLYDHGLISW